jgi:hypothetical protein
MDARIPAPGESEALDFAFAQLFAAPEPAVLWQDILLDARFRDIIAGA